MVQPPTAAPLTRTLARLAGTLAPGSRVTGVRRLRGGLDAAMHTFTLAGPEGPRRLVLRRFRQWGREPAAEIAGRTYRTLDALAALDVAAPRPVWLDAAGEWFGTPALVMTREPGRAWMNPTDLTPWLEQFAGALARLHQLRLDGVDLRFLHTPEEQTARLFTWMERHTAGDRHPDCEIVRETLRDWRARLRPAPTVLHHGDYWAGNTLWSRGRLTAIVDWDGATLGYPGMDVGYARMDLSVFRGLAVGDAFLAAYEAEAGGRIPQLAVWELLGAARALPDPERWLSAYASIDGPPVSPRELHARLHAFITGALARAGGT
jgi:aminoglycoside phosphotransferase (APT) family kinase protein